MITHLCGSRKRVYDGLAGIIEYWPTDVIPAGYLLCDGTAVSRTTYAELYAAIGTRYGNGDGTTTFNLPDFRGQFHRFSNLGYEYRENSNEVYGRLPREDGRSGPVIGSIQPDMLGSHSHMAQASWVPSGANASGRRPLSANTTTNSIRMYTGYTGSGTETRPVNIYVNAIIRYQT